MSYSEKNVMDVEEKIKDITGCPICLDAYKDPKILPCFHTFCMNCLRKTGENTRKNPGDTMPCPVCREEFAIPQTGFGGLQKNFFMEKLTEIRQILKSSSSIILCELCLEEHESATEAEIPSADMYCFDCRQKLCQECCRHHRKNKASKTHNIIDSKDEQVKNLENLQKAFSTHPCEKHEKILEIYCSGCQLVVCIKCLNETHKQHDWLDVSEIATDFRKEILMNRDYLSSVMPDLVEERDYSENYKTKFMQSMDEIQSNVNRRREELKELVEKHADSILSELDTIRQENLKRCEIRKENIETPLVCLESFKTYCSQIAEFGSDTDICRAKSDLDARAKELNALFASTGKRSYQLSHVSFSFTDLQDYWRSPDQNIIGKLDIHESSYPEDNSSELCTRKSEEETDVLNDARLNMANSPVTTKQVNVQNFPEEEESEEFYDCIKVEL